MKSFKKLFGRALAAAPGRLHFAAHSHHLWPDASFEGHLRAWEDAASLADRKWDKAFRELIPTAGRYIAQELKLPGSDSISFAPNTHELIVRLFSAKSHQTPLDVLTSDGEFHSFRRQLARWEEEGMVRPRTVSCEPFNTFTERYIEELTRHAPDIAFVSHVMYQTGLCFEDIASLASCADPDRTWVVVDGYHAFCAFPTDLRGVAGQVFYIGGGYKYAMAGEGVAFLHSPPGFATRPVNTGWFAEFGDIEATPHTDVAYPLDGMRFFGATFDLSGLYRFIAVREMLDSQLLTTGLIHARIEVLRNKLEAAIAMGLAGGLRDAEILQPNALGPRSRFIALRDRRATDWKTALLEHRVVTDSRGDVLRIGLGLYHDEEDVDALCGALAAVVPRT